MYWASMNCFLPDVQSVIVASSLLMLNELLVKLKQKTLFAAEKTCYGKRRIHHGRISYINSQAQNDLSAPCANSFPPTLEEPQPNP